ncbi:Xylosyltransferase 1 [Symbiodinium microadriaticum]|uniref:protein xylosyltransferase n=1 Tax=Symbiodinium microadriaticum TaxID=2951 RepID=A0A1Q9CT44_SYMMI|nr:Xylosyltransferase 1 [Symbiodinium microadriaticum]
MACCAIFIGVLAVLTGSLLALMQRRGLLAAGEAAPDLGIPTASMPTHEFRPGLVESVIALDTPPGNLAVSASGRIIFNFHPMHTQPSGYKFAEVVGDSWIPRLDLDRATEEVLSLRIGSSGRLFLLDHAGHGLLHTPKLVVFQMGRSASEDHFQLAYPFPSEISGFGSMLNDFNLSPDAARPQGQVHSAMDLSAESMLYIADTSIIGGTPALMACSVPLMEQQSKLCHASESIALPSTGRESSSTLVAAAVEWYAEKPISDGIGTDDAGNVLLTAFEHSAVVAITPARSLKVVYRSQQHLQWPDGLSFGPDSWLYVTSSALHHTMRGRNVANHGPFHILRLKMTTGAAPGGISAREDAMFWRSKLLRFERRVKQLWAPRHCCEAGADLALHELLKYRVAAKDNVSMLLSQPTISAKECKKRAGRDLKKLLKAAPEAPIAPIPIECEEHLKDYYCQLILESQSFNTCANLSDEQGLQYFECIARPIQGQKPARTAFASDCNVDSMAASGKGTKASKKIPWRLEVPGKLRIAFLIVAHQAVNNVQRLLQRIYDSSHVYLVHIDRKTPAIKTRLDRFLAGSQLAASVHTFSEIDVTKGSSDLLRISILGLRRLLKLRPAKGEELPWDYFVKLSEFDYPVAPRHALQHYLWLHKGLNFVGLDACSASTCSRHLGTACAGATYSFVSTLRMHKPLSFGMHFARGSEWVALTFAFAKYLVREIDTPSSAMHEIWKDCLLLYQPDEAFFQTAILNSRFCRHHVSMTLHHIPAVLLERRTHGKHDEIGTRSPNVFSHEDLAVLLDAQQPRFFARKFLNVTGEPTSELCRRLDDLNQERELNTAKMSWKGLLPWLEANFTTWAQLAGLAPWGNLTCPARGMGESCEEASIQLLGRLGSGKSATAPTRAGRWSPETWLLQIRGSDLTVLLSERFAVPMLAPEGFAGTSIGVALLATRIGTGWRRERGEFEGHVGVIPATSLSARDLHLAIYWGPIVPDPDTDIQSVVDWMTPDGTKCGQTKVQLSKESHLSGCPVGVAVPHDCARMARPGTWAARIRLRGATSKTSSAVFALREFAVYASFEDLSVVQMQRFFGLELLHKPEGDSKDPQNERVSDHSSEPVHLTA